MSTVGAGKAIAKPSIFKDYTQHWHKLSFSRSQPPVGNACLDVLRRTIEKAQIMTVQSIAGFHFVQPNLHNTLLFQMLKYLCIMLSAACRNEINLHAAGGSVG
jgi:hypothetical protein